MTTSWVQTALSTPTEILLRWRIISATRSYAKVSAIIGHDLDGAEMAVRFEVGWLVGKPHTGCAVHPEFRRRRWSHREFEKGRRRVRRWHRQFVPEPYRYAPLVLPADIRADGVNDSLRRCAISMASSRVTWLPAVVFAITEQNDGTASGAPWALPRSNLSQPGDNTARRTWRFRHRDAVRERLLPAFPSRR